MKNWKQTIGMICGPLGAILVAQGYTLEPNIVWFFSNGILLSYFINNKEKQLSVMYGFYLLISIYGIINLGIYNS